MVVASVSFFISHSQLMDKPRRMLIKKDPRREYAGFFYELATCPYCLGHWLTAILLVVFPINLFKDVMLVDYIFTWLVISWMAGLQSMAMSRLLGD